MSARLMVVALLSLAGCRHYESETMTPFRFEKATTACAPNAGLRSAVVASAGRAELPGKGKGWGPIEVRLIATCNNGAYFALEFVEPE